MKRKVTIVDIAKVLKVTPSTVSKAFSGHPRISLETKRAVENTARQLGYSPNALAKGLRNGKSGLIGVLVPGIHYSFFSTAIKGIEDTLSNLGYNVLIAQSKDRYDLEKQQLNNFTMVQVEGIIASLAMETEDFQHYQTVARRIPLVVFDRTYLDDEISQVMIDDFKGAVIAVDHLVKMGYKRIAHIAGHAHVEPFRKRIEGYKTALIMNSMKIDEDLILHCSPNKDEGAQAAESLFKLDNPPDAILATSDYLALGAMKYIRAKGYSVPEDVGIVGFSNEEFSSQVTPSITTVEQFSESLGITAANCLTDQLKSLGNDIEFVPQKKILEPKLITRESSMRRLYN